MQVSVEKLSPVVVEFSIEVPAQRVKSEVERAYGSLQKTAHIRGYRPGKAPRQVLQHLYSGRIHQDVAQRLVDSTLNMALQEKAVQPLSKPAIAPGELTPEAAFSYKARFEVRPELEKVKWEGLAVNRVAYAIADATIDAEVERLRLEHATEEPPASERPAEKGDLVELGFSLFVGDKDQTNGEQSVRTEIGKGELMKELEDGVIGMNVGDAKDIEVAFPAGHPNPELKGKTGTFKLSLKSIKVRVLPALDDEFAKECGEYATLDALRADLKDKLDKAAKQRQTEQLAEQLVAELCKQNPITVPPSLVEQQASLTERELIQNARRQGQRADSSPEFRARVRADSEMKVRAGLLMAEIAKEKSVKVEEADIEKGYAELAEQTGKNVNKVKAEYRDPKKREMLVAMILEDKILDLLEGAATITEVPAP
ncbi:MAG: trigger factor [Polyangiaceae bacterium]